MEEPRPYESRPVRPLAQLAARVGLWTAVGIGCVGGLVGMFRPTGSGGEQVADDSAIDKEIVPAPVAGVAEEAVETWLLATDEDEGRLAELFVEPPNTGSIVTDSLSLLNVTTVAGERLNDGYWSVTVAADVIETMPGEPEDIDADGDGIAEGVDEEGADDGTGDGVGSGGSQVTTWYVEIGIVGEVGRGLRAISTPGVVPAPPGSEAPWRLIAANPYTPDEDDDLARTIEGFLNALLAGDGDPARYLAPHVDIQAADPAPFTEVQVDQMAAEETDDGVRIWVQATATTPSEARQVVAWEILAAERVDRWEIREIWGAPTVERNPDAQADQPPPAGSGSGSGEGQDADGTTDDTSGTDQGTDDTSADGSTGEDGTSEDTTADDGSVDDGTGSETGTDGSTAEEGTDPLATDPGGE